MIPNLLIVAGTGNKSGKTSMACHLIRQFRNLKIVAVKITPHFHETTQGLELVAEKSGYSVFKETNRDLQKDTSRMLKAGASDVFFAKVTDDSIVKAFKEILKHVPTGDPVICESPALRHYAEPGLFIVMTHPDKDNQKDIKSLLKLPHVEFKLSQISGNEEIPVCFTNGRWISWKYDG